MKSTPRNTDTIGGALLDGARGPSKLRQLVAVTIGGALLDGARGFIDEARARLDDATPKAEPWKAEPAPVQADNRANGLTATDVLSEIEGTVAIDLPAAVDALCDLMDGQAREIRSLLECHGMEGCAAAMIDPAIWTSGQVRTMVQDLKRTWGELSDRDRKAAA